MLGNWSFRRSRLPGWQLGPGARRLAHKPDHCPLHHCPSMDGQPLVVPSEAAAVHQQGQGPPTTQRRGNTSKMRCPGGLLHDSQGHTDGPQHEGHQLARIIAVRPYQHDGRFRHPRLGPDHSGTLATVTCTTTSNQRGGSTTMCRLRPLTFFPLSYPRDSARRCRRPSATP